MSGKAAKRGRFFGRRQHKTVEAAERPQDEEQMPDPRMSSQTWAEWLLFTSQLDQAEEYSR
jgi:hypothetical protein